MRALTHLDRHNYEHVRIFAQRAAIGRVLCCRPHGRSSISNFIYRALDRNVSTGIVMGTVPMTIPVDTFLALLPDVLAPGSKTTPGVVFDLNMQTGLFYLILCH